MSRPVTDLVGNVYGQLTVVSLDYIKNKKSYWVCRCSCGIMKSIRGDGFLSGTVVSCGCYNKRKNNVNIISLVDKVFGRLTVISLYNTKNKKSYWNCQCSCGNNKIVRGDSLTRGLIRSCGCLNKENGFIRATANNRKYRILNGKNPDIPMESGSVRAWSIYRVSKLSQKILHRDDYKCKLYGCSKALKVHHIIPVSKDISLISETTNLVTLCYSCHKKAHNSNWKTVDINIQNQLSQLVGE